MDPITAYLASLGVHPDQAKDMAANLTRPQQGPAPLVADIKAGAAAAGAQPPSFAAKEKPGSVAQYAAATGPEALTPDQAKRGQQYRARANAFQIAKTADAVSGVGPRPMGADTGVTLPEGFPLLYPAPGEQYRPSYDRRRHPVHAPDPHFSVPGPEGY